MLTAPCARAADTCTIEAGLFEGVTLGSTIMVRVPNKDQRSGDYSEMAVAYRRAAYPASQPGHHAVAECRRHQHFPL